MDGRVRNNISQFLASLNTTTTDSHPDFHDLDNIFTSTDFLDFESVDNTPTGHPETMDYGRQDSGSNGLSPTWTQQTSPDYLNTDFSINNFHINGIPQVPGSETTGDALQSLSPSTPYTLSHQLTAAQQQLMNAASQNTPKRRGLSIGEPVLHPAEQARFEAEEDKRRRNTAASARFRVKKKQREQALEKSARDMTEKVTRQENRIKELELENKWLKGLIAECGGEKFKELLDKRSAGVLLEDMVKKET